jgi:hypothetical protein
MKEGEIHISIGVNRESGVYPYPCPHCGSLTYLGVFIPTVSWFTAEYYGISFQCHNLNCAPHYEDGELVGYGAYWDGEGDCYYTAGNPPV